MKTIKKYFKVITSFLIFALLSFSFAFAPVLTTYAAMDETLTNYNQLVSSIKVPKSVDVSGNEEFVVPFVQSALGSTTATGYTIRVIDPAGQNHDYVVGTTEDNSYFENTSTGVKVKILNNGTYKVVYIFNKETKNPLYSNTYSVKVKNVSYELDFAVRTDGDNKGLRVLLPTEVAPNSTNRIELPVANVKIVGKDEYLTDTIAEPIVTKNGKQILTTDENSDYVVDNGKYYIIPKVEGKYTVEYTYNKGANRPTKTFTINVTKDFVAPTSLKISTPTLPTIELGQNVTLPTLTVSDNLNTNVEYNLKSISITKSNNAQVSKTITNNDYSFEFTKDFFGVTNYKDLVGTYEIKYTVEDAYGNSASKTVITKNVTDSTRPSVYMAYDYELETETTGEGDSATTVIKGVKQRPVLDEEGNETEKTEDAVNTDYAPDLKSKYGYSELYLPAIYANDKVTDYKDFKFVRYIRNTNTFQIYYIDNMKWEDNKLVPVKETDQGYNFSGDENIGNYNKAVRFAFSKNEAEDASRYAGEYELGYYVYSDTITKQESQVYISGTTRYTFNVLSTPNVGSTGENASTPTVSIDNVRNNATISIKDSLNVKITSKDIVKNDDEEKVNDSRLKNKVFYYYGTSASDVQTALTNAINAVTPADEEYRLYSNVLDTDELVAEMVKVGFTGFAAAKQDKSNASQFNIDFKNYDEKGKVFILAVTRNDNGNIAIDVKELKVQNETEINPPTIAGIDLKDNFNSDGNAKKEYNQVEEVELPIVKFQDAEDSTLSMNVSYYVNTPETKNAGLQYLSPSNKSMKNNTIDGGTITTSKPGNYVVVYTATDDAGNTSVVYFMFKVNDSSDPILNVDVTGEGIQKSGNTVTANVGTEISFDPSVYLSDGETNVTDDATVDFEIDDAGKGLDYESTGSEYSYRFNSEGNYTVKFTAEYDDKQAIEKVITITIKQVELTWDEEFDVQKYAQTNSTVELPNITASQGNETATITVKVTDPDGQDVAVNYGENDGNNFWSFDTHNGKGTYKVVYTATTSNGKITKTFEIKVGDNMPPTFSMNSESEAGLKQDIVYDGSTQIEYKIDLDRSKNTLKINVTSGDKTIYSYDTGLKMYDRDDTNSNPRELTSWTNFKIELTGENGIVTSGEETNQYLINGTGKCTLKLSMTDSYGNTGTKEIEFNVVSEAKADEKDDTVVGTVLIVISLVILAAVIAFFAFTGKKGGSSKKKAKKNTVIKSVENETVVSDKKEEIVEVEENETEVEENKEESSESNE